MNTQQTVWSRRATVDSVGWYCRDRHVQRFDTEAERDAHRQSTGHRPVDSSLSETVSRLVPRALQPSATVKAASPKSVTFLRSLVADRAPDTDAAFVESVVAAGQARVSKAIENLLARPAPAKAPQTPSAPVGDVPEGWYAVDNADGVLRFYQVQRPTEGRWAGYTFVKVQASDDLYPVRARAEREAVLARIAEAGPQAAAQRYGQEIGRCGRCGRTLTDEESRANGIGPVCRDKTW